ncbi:pentatricopeptide repeat-containing protein at3g58590-like protein [Trifolium pratense]|uniref:Pentatricopeptide repeat-containing protein at3g58590-like protein n=1 Tax=Trifolium pratense TaxID=57577 RepID=A0A2K3NP53_TRIPR|nr:pentatricopeptide repeat-containing protein at3g58590-like protein [Trifolium pratense]
MTYHGHVTRILNFLQSTSTFRSSLDATKRLHALSITTPPIPNQCIFINNNIVSSYIFHGNFVQARKVFDEMPQRTLVSYNALIGCYSRRGDLVEAWRLLNQLRVCGFRPNQYTLTGLLCCEKLELFQGFQLFGLSVKNGVFDADAFVGSALLGFFGRYGCLDEAFFVFDDMSCKSVVTWNTMFSLLSSNGFVEDTKILFHELLGLGVLLSDGSFVALLSGLVGCEEDLSYGEQIHCLMTKLGFDCYVTAINSLIGVYVRCRALCFAERLFEQVPIENVVSWNMIIDSMVKSGRSQMALEMFLNMLNRGLVPSQATFVGVIESCIGLRNLVCGECVHAKVITSGFESDVIVGTALVNFYAKCEKLVSAHNCFDQIEEKNVVSWNALILGYSNVSSPTSVQLLREMLRLECYPNESSFSAVLKSTYVLDLHQLHGLVIRMGYENHEYVLSSLVLAYKRNGLINEALSFVQEFNNPLHVIPSNIIAGIYNRTGHYDETMKLLSLLERPDVVSWNIAISACARSNNYNEVFEVFKRMHSAHICPDKYTFMTVLSVCTKLCSFDLGSSLHGLIVKTNSCDTFLGNVLIDMYGKCGNIENSVKVFEEITDRNVITWTALISALGLNGYAHAAVKIFHNMVGMGFKPDTLALRAVLSSCRYGGLVSEGMKIFKQMETVYGIRPEHDHYHCIVDLLAKNGQTQEAEEVMASMPFPPNANIWRSFLEGYNRHKIAV